MLFSVMGICSHSLTSCSSDDDGGGPKKTALENEFSYNNETTPIGSVVYTKDDATNIRNCRFADRTEAKQGIRNFHECLMCNS